LIVAAVRLSLVAMFDSIAGQALAQGSSDWGTTAPGCMHDFSPFRQDLERRGQLIKEAAAAHAPPAQACKLIRGFEQAEARLIHFVETHAGACEVPSDMLDRLNAGNERTRVLQARVCAVASRQGKR
jgi:hypothetical protein